MKAPYRQFFVWCVVVKLFVIAGRQLRLENFHQICFLWSQWHVAHARELYKQKNMNRVNYVYILYKDG